MIECPICNAELIKNNKVFSCCNHHSFDVAKEGYVNLLLKQSNKQFGDTKEMIAARHAFFQNDYYKPLKEFLLMEIVQFSPVIILDSGCGEGYYTNYLANHLKNTIVLGTDISKEALRIAAKINSNVQYIVASNQKLPFSNDYFDIVLNIFSPIDFLEYHRVLQKDGFLITVSNGSNHLQELKEMLYDEVRNTDELVTIPSGFEVVKENHLSFPILLSNQETIQNLFKMTPYYFRTTLKDKEKLEKYNTLVTTTEFIIRTLQKKTK